MKDFPPLGIALLIEFPLQTDLLCRDSGNKETHEHEENGSFCFQIFHKDSLSATGSISKRDEEEF
jgi:hypothetical protein